MANRILLVLVLGLSFVAQIEAADLLAPGDFIIALDTDIVPNSRYPNGPDFFEGPDLALDSFELSKYLNFGKQNSGLIVTPQSGPSTLQSMQFWTANDFEQRDPSSFELYGTNETIMSTDNSQGEGENWTLISSGDTMLPIDRETPGQVLTFSNATAYSSYRLVFPTLRNAAATDSMQIADVYLFESTDGSGSNVVAFDDPVLAIDTDGPGFQSNYPAAENPAAGIDANSATKYLNFGVENTGFIVTPSAPSVMDSFQITTANDAEERDPASFELYGTNEAIMSLDNEDGLGESWTLIESGALALPADRETLGPVVSVTNSTEYASYKVIFPTLKNAANSMQFADIQFFGEFGMNNVTGDFNNDGNWDCTDIDALVNEISSGSSDLAFDMNGDGVISASDVTDADDGWLAVGGANNPAQTGGNAFLVGDANLDGTVDGLDFIDWNSNKFTNTPQWCGGDFNVDGTIDGLDFIAWNDNKFTSSNPAAVPEPAFGFLVLLLGLVPLHRARRA